MSEYDSTNDTRDHISKVKDLVETFIDELYYQVSKHDASKLESPEKEMYDKYTPLLSATTYGSDEYKQYLSEMGEALQHHYQVNRHHPEHFSEGEGVAGMNLFDVIEMFCDWKAASLRVKDGDFKKSIEYNHKRFGFDNDLCDIFMNTANALDW